jgi:hypothetical protein
MYDTFWWLGCALSVSEESDDVKISFLHPHTPSASYIYPNTATGHTYTLSSEGTKLTAECS